MRAAALTGCLLLAVAAWASVETGVDKWRAGDWDGAVAEWVTPAARGDADALFNMGQAYRLGRGVPESRATALDYYRRAADKGHVGAAANLGITLWQSGRKTEALVHLRHASDKGDIRASYVLGVATFGGDVAPKNPSLGYAYVIRARDGGLAMAGPQATRMAALMSAQDLAAGEAAARALASGQPVAVALAAPPPRETTVITGDDSEEDQDEAVTARSAKSAESQPEKAPAKPTPQQVEGWKVQLGAYANERSARTAWATLVSQSADLLKGRTPIYSPKGNLVRLQVGAFDRREDAGALCTKLAATGRPCFVTKG